MAFMGLSGAVLGAQSAPEEDIVSYRSQLRQAVLDHGLSGTPLETPLGLSRGPAGPSGSFYGFPPQPRLYIRVRTSRTRNMYHAALRI